MEKIRPPIEPEELAIYSEEAWRDIETVGSNPRLVLRTFLDRLKAYIKSYVFELFDFTEEYRRLELWQMEGDIEDRAAMAFEDPEETKFWKNHIKDIIEYVVMVDSVASEDALNEMSAQVARDFALLVLGSFSISSKLSERPYDHSVDGPRPSEFKCLSGPYPRVREMRPDSLMGEMAGIIEAGREVWAPDTKRIEDKDLFAERIRRQTLPYVEQYVTRGHYQPEMANYLRPVDSDDMRILPAHAKDFIVWTRGERLFRATTKEFGEISDAQVFAIGAIRSAYEALLCLQHREYRPHMKIDQERLDLSVLKAQVFRRRMDYENAGKLLQQKRPLKPFYQALLDEMDRNYATANLEEHSDKVLYRHKLVAKLKKQFDDKGTPRAEDGNIKSRLKNKAFKPFSWAAWSEGHGTSPSNSDFIPREVVLDEIKKRKKGGV